MIDPPKDPIIQRSLHGGRGFDMPPQTVRRCLTEKTISPRMVGRADDWNTVQDITAHNGGLGIHIADLTTKALPEGKQFRFTFYCPDADYWKGADFVVRVGPLRRGGTTSAEGSKTNAK
ncbi:MAG: hypothetical protein ABSH08_19975 [Tepidisphaeraceae bacterium]|jgi:hypothetical protein